MISVDMYVDLLPNFLRPLSRLVSTFRHKRRRSIVTIRFLRSMMNSFLRALIARTSDLAKSESEIGIQHDAVTGLP